MTNKIFFTLFSLLSLCVNAQETKSKFSQSPINIILNDEVENEAQTKRITQDYVYINFIITTKCEIVNFKIAKPATLISLNLAVEKQKDKIIDQLKKIFECNSEKNSSFTALISVNFEQ